MISMLKKEVKVDIDGAMSKNYYNERWIIPVMGTGKISDMGTVSY